MDKRMDLEASLKNIFEELRKFESSMHNEVLEKTAAEALQEENAKLKEKNICLERKMTEMQSKMDSMKDYCQTIISSGHGFKQFQETVAKTIPKFMEDENMAMAEKVTKLELDIFHVNQDKQRCQEKMQQQQQKLDRLLDSNKQLTGRLATVEKQFGLVKDTCQRFEPAVKALAKRCAAQHRNQLHYRCLEEQANTRIAEECRRTTSLQTQLAMAIGRLLAQNNEIQTYKSIISDQRTTISFCTKQVTELEAKIEELKVKLTEAQELIRDQSELLSRNLSGE